MNCKIIRRSVHLSLFRKPLCHLAGFAPAFSAVSYASLEEQLKDFGAGIEVTLLAAIPAGSGLGTSSILASTVLGAINDFCGLAWDKMRFVNVLLSLNNC